MQWSTASTVNRRSMWWLNSTMTNTFSCVECRYVYAGSMNVVELRIKLRHRVVKILGLSLNEEWAKMRKSENSYANSVCYNIFIIIIINVSVPGSRHRRPVDWSEILVSRLRIITTRWWWWLLCDRLTFTLILHIGQVSDGNIVLVPCFWQLILRSRPAFLTVLVHVNQLKIMKIKIS